MKLLLDTSISHKLIPGLLDAGHDAVWAGDPVDVGDESILEQAFLQGRIVITLDKDFAELAARKAKPHSGIVRLVKYPSTQHLQEITKILRMCGTELAAGSIVTAERGRDARVRLAKPQK